MCKIGDGRPAIGTGVRPIEYCRPCHVAAYEAEFQAWKVGAAVAQADDIEGIACAKTGETIPAGGTVWLDPVDTNIPALQYAGFIEPLPAAAPAKAAKTGA